MYQTINWWSQLKSAGSTIYANRHCLQLYKKRHPERLLGVGIQDRQVKQVPKIIGDVFIHPTAYIHHTAVVSCIFASDSRVYVSVFIKRDHIVDSSFCFTAV